MSVVAIAVVLWLLPLLLALSWPARVVRPSVVLAATLAGTYASTTLAFGLQTLLNRTVAGMAGDPLDRVVERAGYFSDPVLEELAKLAPLLAVLTVVPWTRRQWGLTDHLMVAAGLGGGFGLLEVIATAPPAAAEPLRTIGAHLGWTALAGFGVGMLSRAHGIGRVVGGVPMLLAGCLHIRENLAIGRPEHPLALTDARIVVVCWLLPLVALAVALIVDIRVVRAGKRARPDLLLTAERAGTSSVRALQAAARLRVGYSAMVVARFVRLRRSVYYAGADLAAVTADSDGQDGGDQGTGRSTDPSAEWGGEPPSGRLWRLARSIRADLDAAHHAEAWHRPDPTQLRSVARAAAVSPFPIGPAAAGFGWVVAGTAALPVGVFVLLGSLPGFEGIRRAMVAEGGTVAALLATVVAVAMLGWRAVSLGRVVRHDSAVLLADSVALLRLTFVGSVGAGVAGITLVGATSVELAASANPVGGAHMHLMPVLSAAPAELLCWMVSGFLPMAAARVVPPSAVLPAAIGPLGSTMLRRASDRAGGVPPGTPAGTSGSESPPARLDRSMRQLRPSEQRTALALARQERFRGRTFRRPDSWSLAAMHADWVDDAGGRYDAYGDWTSAHPDGDLRRFLDRLDMHLMRDVDYTVVDLTGFGRWQIAIVSAHLENPPPAVREHLHKLVRVGF